MDNQLTKAQAIQLFNALNTSGVDCATVKNQNPLSPEFSQTKTGQYFQMFVSANAPQLAADLKREAGHIESVASLAMAAALAENIDPGTFEGTLREEYIAASPVRIQQADALTSDQHHAVAFRSRVV